ncbi:MAG: transporter permease [Pseudomonadota bacterium]
MAEIPGGGRGWRAATHGALAAALAVFVLLPLVALAPYAGDGQRALGEGRAAVNTLVVCGGTLLVAAGCGVPVGWALSRVRLPRVLQAACTLPYAIPPYVTTIAWITLANPRNGLLLPWLPVDVYTRAGMAWVLGLHLSPFVSLATRDALGAVDPALEEAARVSGAGALRTARDVTLPMVAPALAAAGGFVVAASAASFGVPYLLGSAAREPVPVLTTRIAQTLELSPVDGRPLAVTLAGLLLLLGAGVPALLRLLQRRATHATARPARPSPPRPMPLAAAGVAVYVTVAVVLPLGTLVASSVMDRFGGGLAPDNLTLRHWVGVLGDPRNREALGRSGWLAAAAATVAVGVGALVAHGAERDGGRAARTLAALARVGWTVPGTVLALGLLLSFSQEIRLVVAERVTFTLALADTVWFLGIAYVARFLALPVDGSRAALRAIHPSLEEAARVSGAGWATVLRDVTVPLLAPALRTAWFLVFVPAFCEVTLSVMLRGPSTEVLGTRLFTLQSYADPQAAAVLAVIVGGLVFVGLAVRPPGRAVGGTP